MNWPAFWLSLQVNAIASVIILVAGLLIALMLVRTRFRGKNTG